MTETTASTSIPIEALLFDLDGTLAHTDPLHLVAMRALLEDEGLAIDEATFVTRVSGQPNDAVGRYLFPDRSAEEHRDFIDRKEARFRDMAGDLAPLAGVVAFIDRARADGLRIALVTNAPRKNVAFMLETLGIADRFEIRIYGDELERGKPDPLPYRLALEAFGLTPHQAIAFEDSLPGLAAAKGAGLVCVGIATSRSVEELTAAGADFAVEDFTDASVVALHDRQNWNRTTA
ncbi:HAD-IA family hydrolase [uncultured Aureimonas sp.]|uniref:HAD family hydrolase n=1 Tax=uncultured Aureimonas sp. TaxID=1604662 RepID=UPI0025E7F1C8|nr:HAD-IA family hydrolase [uncultured Aureimonas sp.]